MHPNLLHTHRASRHAIDIRAISSSRSLSLVCTEVVNGTAAALLTPAWRLSTPQRMAWAHVFAALRENGTISVVTLGGSMAHGQGCTADPSAHVRCAYSGRLVAWLRTAYPHATILFENRAIGGMTTGMALLSLPSLSRPVMRDEDATSDTDDEGGGDDRNVGGESGESPAGQRRALEGRPSASVILIDYA